MSRMNKWPEKVGKGGPEQRASFRGGFMTERIDMDKSKFLKKSLNLT